MSQILHSSAPAEKIRSFPAKVRVFDKNGLIKEISFNSEFPAHDKFEHLTRSFSDLAQNGKFTVQMIVTHPENGELIRREMFGDDIPIDVFMASEAGYVKLSTLFALVCFALLTVSTLFGCVTLQQPAANCPEKMHYLKTFVSYTGNSTKTAFKCVADSDFY